ncbi:MAG: 50S ribosomal protein L31 [Patescibacteria group bacterium]
MKQNIHPQYYPEAKVKCACGNEFTVGATMPEIKIEVCSNCHPFYTGKGMLLDSKGRVERFKKRLERSAKKKK